MSRTKLVALVALVVFFSISCGVSAPIASAPIASVTIQPTLSAQSRTRIATRAVPTVMPDIRVIVGACNLRESADTSKGIGVLYDGTRVKVLAVDGNWLRIETVSLDDNLSGWVNSGSVR